MVGEIIKLRIDGMDYEVIFPNKYSNQYDTIDLELVNQEYNYEIY